MRIIRIFTVIAICLLFTATLNAQKVSLESGDIRIFNNIQELNIEFDFSEFGVGRLDKEEKYIEMKRDVYNENEPGRGDAWVKEWHADKKKTYEPRFINRFNEIMTRREESLRVGKYADAEYSLIVKTTYMEPGFNVGVHSKRAFIYAEFFVVKTNDKEKRLLHLVTKKIKGAGEDSIHFDAEIRLGTVYSTVAYFLAMYIYKKALK